MSRIISNKNQISINIKWRQVKLYEDEFNEIIINFSAICSGTDPALDFVLNEEPKAPENIKICLLQKIKLTKTTEEMFSNFKPIWEAAINQLKEDGLYNIGPYNEYKFFGVHYVK